MSWIAARLDEVAEIVLGQSPPGSFYNADGEGRPFFQGKAEFGDLTPTVQKWTTAGSKFARAGDVLLSIRAPVGPTNLAPTDCVIGRGLAAVRPLGGIDSRYVLWAIRASVRSLAELGTGSTFEAVNGNQVRAHTIAVAPLAEQRRIVAAIEEHFSRLDAADASLSAAFRRLDALRRSAVVDAIGDDWMTRRMERLGDGSRHALAIGPFGSNLKVSDYADSGVPLIFVRDIRRRAFGGPGTRFISAEKAKALAAHQVRAGDLLVTKMGDPPGDAAVYPSNRPPAVLTADCIKVTPCNEAEAAYLALTFVLHGVRTQIARITSGVAQKKVSLARFKTVEIPVPPLDEQRRIVARIEEQLSAIDAARAAIERAQARSRMLRRAILERAFRGELVTQAPADEPAEALLARIRAERAMSERATGGHPRRRATMSG